MEENVHIGKLIGSMLKEKSEGLETFLVRDGGVKGLDVHGKEEAIGAWKLKVVEEVPRM